jgi:hypothetical protein
MQIGKKEVKLFIFADHKNLYLKDSKDSNRKLLDLINKWQDMKSTFKYSTSVYSKNDPCGKQNK